MMQRRRVLLQPGLLEFALAAPFWQDSKKIKKKKTKPHVSTPPHDTPHPQTRPCKHAASARLRNSTSVSIVFPSESQLPCENLRVRWRQKLSFKKQKNKKTSAIFFGLHPGQLMQCSGGTAEQQLMQQNMHRAAKTAQTADFYSNAVASVISRSVFSEGIFQMENATCRDIVI